MGTQYHEERIDEGLWQSTAVGMEYKQPTTMKPTKIGNAGSKMMNQWYNSEGGFDKFHVSKKAIDRHAPTEGCSCARAS